MSTDASSTAGTGAAAGAGGATSVGAAAGTLLTEDGAIPLVGQPNARDLGAYRTAAGRAIRADMLVRSGKLDACTDDDLATLVGCVGMRHIVDLRCPSEVATSPDPLDKLALLGGVDARFAPVTTPHDAMVPEDENGTAGLAVADDPSAASRLVPTMERALEVCEGDCFGYMSRLYARFALDDLGAEGYRELFATVLEANGATLWHCSSGKDRAGMGAALVLSTLGCDRETVIADYLRSRDNLAAGMESLLADVRAAGGSDRLLDDLRIVNDVDRHHVDYALDAVLGEYGSYEGYLTGRLGFSSGDVRDLARICLA